MLEAFCHIRVVAAGAWGWFGSQFSTPLRNPTRLFGAGFALALRAGFALGDQDHPRLRCEG